MRLTPGMGLGLVLVAAVLIGLAVTDASAPRSCGDANASLAGKRLDDASKAFSSILKEEPKSDCASTGMEKVARRLCVRAKRIDRSGHPADAQKVYSTALALEPPDHVYRYCKVPKAKTCDTQEKPADTPTCLVVGPQGPPGEDGNDGTDGKDGKDGRDGKNGRDGKDGRDGRDGRDAKPCCTG